MSRQFYIRPPGMLSDIFVTTHCLEHGTIQGNIRSVPAVHAVNVPTALRLMAEHLRFTAKMLDTFADGVAEEG